MRGNLTKTLTCQPLPIVIHFQETDIKWRSCRTIAKKKGTRIQNF